MIEPRQNFGFALEAFEQGLVGQLAGVQNFENDLFIQINVVGKINRSVRILFEALDDAEFVEVQWRLIFRMRDWHDNGVKAQQTSGGNLIK
jgi:hypothetical protein